MHGSMRRGLETEQTWPWSLGVAQPSGKPAEERPQALPSASHRASPRPYVSLAWWLRLLWLGVQMERMAPPSMGIIAPVM